MSGSPSRNGAVEPNETAALLGGHEREEGTPHGSRPGTHRRHSSYKNERHWTHWPLHAAHLTWATLARDYVNLLLIFVPLGIVAGALKWNASAIFALNFFAIIPLASLLSFATEELAAVMGQAMGGLLNATFGNAVELIVSTLHVSRAAPAPANQNG